jgi:hypothetical protein
VWNAEAFTRIAQICADDHIAERGMRSAEWRQASRVRQVLSPRLDIEASLVIGDWFLAIPMEFFRVSRVQSVFEIRVKAVSRLFFASLRLCDFALNPNYRTTDLGRKITGQKNGGWLFSRMARIGAD